MVALMTDTPAPAGFITLAPSPDPQEPFFRHSAVIDNSEFLAFAARTDTASEALAQLDTLRQRYPDATHHCWAYQIAQLYRFSDDGEPGGTAGQPILRAVQGQGLDHTLCVVVRYYGGTKLGTGGLVRAYGSTAAECLRLATRLQVRPRLTRYVSAPYDQVSILYHLLGQYDLLRGPEEYSGVGVRLEIQLFAEDLHSFAQALRDATRGTAQVVDT